MLTFNENFMTSHAYFATQYFLAQALATYAAYAAFIDCRATFLGAFSAAAHRIRLTTNARRTST